MSNQAPTSLLRSYDNLIRDIPDDMRWAQELRSELQHARYKVCNVIAAMTVEALENGDYVQLQRTLLLLLESMG